MASASLGFDNQVLNAIDMWIVAVRPVKDGRSDVQTVIINEQRPDLGELSVVADTVTGSISGEVQDVLVPISNYMREESLWFWTGWLQGQQVCARTNNTAVAAVQCDSRPWMMIRPAMTVRTGELDMLLLAAEGRELQFIRFTPGQGGQAPHGSVVFRMPLAAKPVAARAALGPVRAKSPRRLLLAFQEKDGAALHLYDLGEGKQPGPPVIVKLPDQTLLPAQEPALRVDDDGATFASVLLASPAKPTNLSIADVLFPLAGAPQQKIAAARNLPVNPVAATLTYAIRPDRPMRRDWAVLMANGLVSHSQTEGDPMKVAGLPVVPLDLAAMSQATYMLTQTLLGPTLDPLR